MDQCGPCRGRLVGARRFVAVAEWGDVERVDMTFSVVKSYLAMVAGLAVAEGRIDSVHDRVAGYVDGDYFDGEHNAAITWHHLLQQTSDWSGSLWEIHDWADRPEGDDPEAWPDRQLHEPGTRFKYNDVRVNLLALSLLGAGFALVLAVDRLSVSAGFAPRWYLRLRWPLTLVVLVCLAVAGSTFL